MLPPANAQLMEEVFTSLRFSEVHQKIGGVGGGEILTPHRPYVLIHPCLLVIYYFGGVLWTHVFPTGTFFFNCMFFQLLRVQHSCSSTQSWDSVLPPIVETRDQNSRGCPLLFSKRILGSICAYIGIRNPIHPQLLGSCGPLQE